MKASYNWKDREELNDYKFAAKLYEKKDAAPELYFELNQSEIKLKNYNAELIIEAYIGSKVSRYKQGPWKNYQPKNIILNEFNHADSIKFRIKIVDLEDPLTPILAFKDQIRLITYDSDGKIKKSILPLHPVELGAIAWKIDWSQDDAPNLQVNSKISAAYDVVTLAKSDPDFALLVFPQAIREILTRLLLKNKIDEDDDNDWINFALRFVDNICDRYDDEEKDTAEVYQWVEEVIDEFSKELNLLDKYLQSKK